MLFNVFEDEKNIKFILNTFEILKGDNNKLVNQISELKVRNEEVRKEISENEKKILQYKKDSKLAKKQMEKFLTDTLKRKITIMGDINLL